ncbi:Hsp33 family molecular chaperone HslO [Acetobacterium carbinolicum]|jgi:molecular chaperone Hsp33|uniref:Hsp33 family molecular chaperone HslO n=1 Tax=Acetobacterium TaxID=33951 RepID=UPI000DBEB76C|nr:Hsp33 family molecular chaperone HslO [Acetobacterium sp. KB-1]AWW25288.1 Hsp33 family molecular chaperone HslO [Acetobacterium sp. KB-1]
MPDYVLKATAGNGQIRVFAATTGGLAETARKLHQTSPVVTKALGRLLTAGSLMGSMMKNADELITLKIAGDGPISGLLVTADAKGNVKGYPYVNDLLDTLEASMPVSEAIGEGTLNILKDIGLKEPYVGYSPLVSGELAEDLTYYYAQSEQIPTSVSLGVLLNDDGTVRQAGGFIIQLMPNTDDEVIDALEVALSDTPSLTKLLDEGKTLEAIMDDLFKDLSLKISKTEITRFICDCSRQRITKALTSIGKNDLIEMISDQEDIEVNCDFCKEKYSFSPEDLQSILDHRTDSKEQEG